MGHCISDFLRRQQTVGNEPAAERIGLLIETVVALTAGRRCGSFDTVSQCGNRIYSLPIVAAGK